MSKIYLAGKHSRDVIIGDLLEKFSRKVEVYPPGTCPLTVQLSLLHASMNQTCGKCVPCRVGLGQLNPLIRKVLNGNATMETLDTMEQTAKSIMESADCAIGYEAAKLVLKCIDGCEDDFKSHIERGFCSCNSSQPVSCVKSCPAGVDIPGYIALVHEKRYADAVRLIRRDNPLPTTCAYICEHPCENRCKRTLIDAPVNIRGLKKMAVDNAGNVPVPECGEATGKKVAIIGGGPGGLSAGYYLALMGHKVTIFEQRKQLGGMLRYGIPNYRLPRKKLDDEIASILSTGIEVRKNVSVGVDVTIEELHKEYDAMYISIGAHADKKMGIEGEDAKEGVTSAVEMLRVIGDDEMPDYTGKKVVVIGGGNVAMDVARSSVRLGAEKVSIVYRRRKADMTALEEEVEGAEAEGCDILELMSPVRIEKDEHDRAVGLWVQPQMIGAYRGGRPSPVDSASKEPLRVPCDVVLIAVGQDIISEPFEAFGMPAEWHVFQAGLDTAVEGMPGVFVGGDCATGPSTAIKAIAAGKVAAHNIDEYLGYHHTLTCEAVVPEPKENMRDLMGRTEIGERPANIRKKDFEHVEELLTHEEAMQEACRCLRCDHFGCGAMVGGRDL